MQDNDTWSTTPTVLPSAKGRWVEDVRVFVVTVAVMVLLGAPAGLLWAAVAPHYTVRVTDQGLQFDNIESTKAFIGADGAYAVVVLVLGLLCGALAWRFGRRGGPWTVAGLVLGGVLAALVAAEVGLRPGAPKAFEALQPGSGFRGSVDLYLGRRTGDSNDLALRAPWALVMWPIGALVSFLVPAYRRPEQLD